jgi:hypothetical protein
MMQAWSSTAWVGRFNFGRGEIMMPDRVKKPLAERILLRCPRIASALAAVGAKGTPKEEGADTGALAAMMTASGSIDFVGRGRKNFRFYIRPMA